MLKLIHCADIHLGSKIEAKLSEDKAAERRRELRQTFNRMIEYARKNGVRAILLSGDVFDSDRPFKYDKEFFYGVVKGHPEIDFIYLRGNHDGETSYTEDGMENLKVFSSEWVSYSYEGVDISGIELCAENELSLYSSLNLNSERLNIVMLHGTVADRSGAGLVNLRELKNRSIDYLALGHYHSYNEGDIDTRGKYAYSGCLEGRGFDETGEKGFVLLEIDSSIKSRFIPFACRTVRELTVDIGDCDGSYSAYNKISNEFAWSANDLLRVILSGEIGFENENLSTEVCERLSEKCYFASVKDKTVRRFNVDDYKNDLSIRGEFIRTVLSCEDIDESEKQKIISYGLRALAGREVE